MSTVSFRWFVAETLLVRILSWVIIGVTSYLKFLDRHIVGHCLILKLMFELIVILFKLSLRCYYRILHILVHWVLWLHKKSGTDQHSAQGCRLKIWWLRGTLYTTVYERKGPPCVPAFSGGLHRWSDRELGIRVAYWSGKGDPEGLGGGWNHARSNLRRCAVQPPRTRRACGWLGIGENWTTDV